MSDLSTTTATGPDRPEQPALDVVLTCCTCDQTYEPTPDTIARGRLGCPDPDCGGWTFSSALTVPPAPGRCPVSDWNEHSNDLGDYCPWSGQPAATEDDDARCPAGCAASALVEPSTGGAA